MVGGPGRRDDRQLRPDEDIDTFLLRALAGSTDDHDLEERFHKAMAELLRNGRLPPDLTDLYAGEMQRQRRRASRDKRVRKAQEKHDRLFKRQALAYVARHMANKFKRADPTLTADQVYAKVLQTLREEHAKNPSFTIGKLPSTLEAFKKAVQPTRSGLITRDDN